MKPADLTPAVRDKMKKVFAECYRAVLACEDETGRKRCELFRDLPDKRVMTSVLFRIFITNSIFVDRTIRTTTN